MNFPDACNEDVKFKWVDSLKLISRDEWTAVFGDKVIKSYDFFLSMEESHFVNVNYFYLEVSCKKEVIAIVPCFTYGLDIIDILLETKMKSIISCIRKYYPNFMKLKTFVIGSYAASCEYFVEFTKGLPDKTIEEVKQVIKREINLKSIEAKASIVFIKEIKQSRLAKAMDFFSPEFHFFTSFPNTFIPIIKEYPPYPATLKKKHRKRYRKFKKLFDESFTWEIVTDFKDYTELMERLYLNVLAKSKNKFDILNEAFFRNLNKRIPDSSYLLIARDKNDEIRLIELLLEESDRLIPLYLGIDYRTDDTKVLYLNTIFKTIELAEKKDKLLVEFGQTSYYPKVMSGALVELIYYGFSSPKKGVQYFIKHFFKYLFKPISVPQNIYLAEYKEKIEKKYTDWGFDIYNR